MRDQFSVADRATVVTGGSSGIGRAIAERFADDGAQVLVCSREQDNVDPVAAGIEDDGGTAVAVECDVRDRDAVAEMVATAEAEFGGLDCLVNNAGASFMAGFDDISPNGWATIVEVNLTGTVNCCQAAADALKDGGGTVVNMASVAGQQGAPHMSHYGAAKAGVVNLTRTLAWEWAGEGVRVNCIAPGYVATPGVEEQMGITAEEVERDEVERRMGEPAEIADVAQFLASDAASFLVGETVSPQGVPDIMEEPTV